MKQWHLEKNHPLKPEHIAAGSNKKVWWKCNKGFDHEWAAVVNSRTGKGSRGCPFCTGNKVSVTNSLATLHPKLAEEWYPTKNGNLTPDKVVAGSGSKVWWRCSLNPLHEWEAPPDFRTPPKETGCPYCAGNKLADDTSLATRYPELAQEWHPSRNGGITPDKVHHGASKAYWWKCTKGPDHEWKATVNNRTLKKIGCACCDGKRVSVTNSLTTCYPEIAKQWHPTKNGNLTPELIVAGSNKKYWWLCPNNADHEWQTTASSRTGKRKTGCPYCNLGIHGDLWKKWEDWCQKVLTFISPHTAVIQPYTRLPNNKVHDFSYKDKWGKLVIVDAKTNAFGKGVEEDIDHYLPYSDRMEFWCLFLSSQRTTIKIKNKDIIFVSPTLLLEKVPEQRNRSSLIQELNEIFEYAKNPTNIKSKTLELMQRTLTEFLNIKVD
ncbi:MAG: zinc-ribbon domain-containing protein [Candidatus Hodarchaeales archaeon]